MSLSAFLCFYVTDMLNMLNSRPRSGPEAQSWPDEVGRVVVLLDVPLVGVRVRHVEAEGDGLRCCGVVCGKIRGNVDGHTGGNRYAVTLISIS